MIDKKIGHCIICHQDTEELSDEHVIPKAIGGYYHTYNVCKKCNNVLGEKVDPTLINHPISQLIRFSQKIKGYKGSYPNPFANPEPSTDGTKYSVTEDEDGMLTPHILPIPKYIYAEDGCLKSFHITLDIENRNNVDAFIDKILKKKGIDKSNVVKEEKIITERPTLRYHFEIPLKDFNLGILKIAYEFTCDCIPDYEFSQNGQLLSSILLDANPQRLDEISISDNNIKKKIEEIFGEYINFSLNSRHYLFLLNLEDKLVCVVKLFNTFCVGFVMDNKRYRAFANSYVLVNDIDKHQYEKFSIEQLCEKISGVVETSFVLSRKQYKGHQKLKRLDSTTRPYKKSPDGYVLLVNSNYPIGSVPEYILTIGEKSIKSYVLEGYYIIRYLLPKGVFIIQESTEELIPIDEIQTRSKLTKY
nr:HNH endonuclease [uncultured Porphyromonas sp.]